MNVWEYVAIGFGTEYACDKDDSYVVTRSAIWGWLDRMEPGQHVTFNPIDAIVARTALQSQL